MVQAPWLQCKNYIIGNAFCSVSHTTFYLECYLACSSVLAFSLCSLVGMDTFMSETRGFHNGWPWIDGIRPFHATALHLIGNVLAFNFPLIKYWGMH